MTADSNSQQREERRQQIVGAVFLLGLVLLLTPLLFDRVARGDASNGMPELGDRSAHPAPLGEAYTPQPVEIDESVLALAEPLLAATDEEGFRTDTGVRFGDPAFLPANDTRAAEWTSWGVQAGSFAELENARELRRLLRGDGHHVSFSRVKVAGEQVTRVAVGPVLQRADAERLRQTLADTYGLPAILVKFET